VTVDVAYGGNFYAIVDPQAVFRDIADVNPSDLLRWSPKLRAALNAKYEFVHPENPAINGSATSSGPARRPSPRRTPATPCSMATRRSTVRPAAPAPPRAWRNGRRRETQGRRRFHP
jgi:proline racemase